MNKEINNQPKKVFTGIIFDVYHWQQKMFDNSLATFEKLSRTNTVKIILYNSSKDVFLIAYEKQPTKKYFYGLFGGRLNKNEKPLNGIKRELLEETGLKANKIKLLFKTKPYDKIDWQVYYYLSSDFVLTQKQNLDNGEKITIKEFKLKDIFKLIINNKFHDTSFSLYLLKLYYQSKGDFKKIKKALIS